MPALVELDPLKSRVQPLVWAECLYLCFVSEDGLVWQFSALVGLRSAVLGVRLGREALVF